MTLMKEIQKSFIHFVQYSEKHWNLEDNYKFLLFETVGKKWKSLWYKMMKIFMIKPIKFRSEPGN